MNAQDLEWNDLHTVLAVCREGTLSGAARILEVSHSTVLRRIDSVEKKLGVRVFDRLPMGYVMTEAGELMLETGERVENEMLGLSRTLIGRDMQLHGTIRVAVPDALLLKVLMPHLNTFSEKFPKIHLELVISNDYLNLTKREADIAIRVTESPPDALIGRCLCEVKTTIYASNEYLRKHLDANIESYAWLMPDEDLIHLPITKWLQKKHPKATIVLRCNTILCLYEAAYHNIGVTALPCFLADPEPQLRRIIPPPDELTSKLWLLIHPELRQTARIQIFKDFLIEIFMQEKILIEGCGISCE